MGLSISRGHLISEVISGMTNPNSIGSKIRRRNGIDISAFTKVTGNFPQKSYAAVICAIQFEWIFLQRVMKDTGQAFARVKKFLRETFFPRLFL